MKRKAATTSRRKKRASDDEYSDDEDDVVYSSPTSSDDDDLFLPPKASTRKKSSSTRPLKKRQLSSSTPNPPATEGMILWSHPTSTHIVPKAHRPAIRRALIDWFEGVRDKRGMPWRKRYDAGLSAEGKSQRAYEVWVSEIMLQQTQVATVIPYYNRWMSKFPTIRDLASASIDEVNALWKGLGYYSRASRLLLGSQKVLSSPSRLLPTTAKSMEAEIPGIGRYSAGAICSIAYAEPVPVLDGNVNRLMSRFLALHAQPKAKATLDVLWAGAGAMVDISDTDAVIDLTNTDPVIDVDADTDPVDADTPSENRDLPNPGDINQALIELGSTVCKPTDPQCSICPLRPWCAAYNQSHSSSADSTSEFGTPLIDRDIEDLCTLCAPLPVWSPTSFPMKAERKKAREETDLVCVIEYASPAGDRWFLLSRRPATGLLAGLHEFPTLPDIDSSASPRGLEQRAGETVSSFIESTTIAKVKPMGTVPHVFSHIKKEYRVVWVVLGGGEKGDAPPPIRAGPRSTSASTSTLKVKKAKTKKSTKSSEPEVTNLDKIDATWVPFAEIPNANIGTGMGKVWSLVCAMWGEES